MLPWQRQPGCLLLAFSQIHPEFENRSNEKVIEPRARVWRISGCFKAVEVSRSPGESTFAAKLRNNRVSAMLALRTVKTPRIPNALMVWPEPDS